MIYDKQIDRICAFCQRGEPLTDDLILCHRCGPVTLDHSCRKFVYDPLRRKPILTELPKSRVTPEEFKL